MSGAVWGAAIISALAGALAYRYGPRIRRGHHRKADEVP